MTSAEKWSALFLAALPQILMAAWLYYRTWMMELEWRAQWSQYLTGFSFCVLVLSIFLTLFIFPVPKKMKAKPLPLGEKYVPPIQKPLQPIQSPHRGYCSIPGCYIFPRTKYYRDEISSKPFSLQDLWKKILRYLYQK